MRMIKCQEIYNTTKYKYNSQSNKQNKLSNKQVDIRNWPLKVKLESKIWVKLELYRKYTNLLKFTNKARFDF